MNAADLRERKCTHQENALSADGIAEYLTAIGGWAVQDGRIVRSFSFEHYYATLAFVNAIAYVAHAEDHHPELVVTYNKCIVRYDTHSVNGGRGGLSPNDFICAAKIDAVFEQSFA
jgi:4a-hydroxytetrahydrobiopterin dehydratase